MGYLNGPRINFWGGGRTNVDTANNADHGIVDLERAVVTSSESDDALIAKLREHDKDSRGKNYYTVAGWNYYGDHQVAFMDVKVSSAGPPGAVTKDTDLAGQPVFLLGSVDPNTGDGPSGGPLMVDLDATSSQTTRILVGGLQIGAEEPILKVRHDTYCHSHLLGLRYDSSTTAPPFSTPGSVYANGTFQLAFPSSSIVTWDRGNGLLRSIVEAEGAIGIVLRFSMFEYMPGLSTDELQASYGSNDNAENPSLGRIVGTIGPWFPDEPATCPPGRMLRNQNLGGASGLAHLDTGSGLLSLDLLSAMPGEAIRQDSKANTGRIGPNVDYGDLRIGTDSGELASTPSLPADYFEFGGIYDLSLSREAASALAAQSIEIRSSKGGLEISEQPLRIFSDARNIYLDEVSDRAEFTLLVRERGGPVSSDTTLQLSPGATGTLSQASLKFDATAVVPAGRESVNLVVEGEAGSPGFTAVNIAGAGGAAYFVNFRKYPVEDFSSVIASGSIPWATVYENCLRFYYILFPAMSKRIPLNDEATIRAVGSEILKRISDDYRSTTLYMPVTRSMSPGAIQLLRAWLNERSGPPAA